MPVIKEVMRKSCATCPFRKDSKYRHLATGLARSALSEGSPICHSTGSNNAINRRTGQPAKVCRGARDIQLEFLASIGYISAATDEAWTEKCEEVGI